MDSRTIILNMKLDNQILKELREIIPDWNIVSGDKKEDFRNAEIVLHWTDKNEKVLLDDNENLRWVQAWSAGVNDLPLNKLQEKGVIVTSANGVHAYPISETIFALMLSLTRKIHTYVQNQTRKIWTTNMPNLEMHDKTIGIIGVGAIGQETARLAKAFGMEVLGVRRSGKETPYVDEMYTNKDLNLVLNQSDYVIITLPLTADTKNLFTENQFKQMKKSAFIINIGRGPIINEKSLIRALKNKEIAGAGLDVFEIEPLPIESPLWEMENVIITPHASGSTENYDKRVISDIVIPNLRHYLKTNELYINVIDYDKGY